MNILYEIAEKLDIKIGVPFKIKECHGNFILSENGSFIGEKTRDFFPHIFAKLLTGELEIIHKPWKPKCDMMYFVISLNNHIDSMIWDDSVYDILCYKIGNCFKTEEEAEQNKERILSILKSDKMLVEVEE